MSEVGLLSDDDPVELLEGEVRPVSPQDPLHAARVAALAQRLAIAYRGAHVHVRSQLPLAAPPHSLPEPDLAVVKGAPLDYMERHPTGSDTSLVVEIARTSQDADRRKARIYAEAGVSIYWLVDLVAHRLEIFAAPTLSGNVAPREVLSANDSVEVPSLGVRWPVSDLVG